MADDKRISELPLATTPLAGTEELEIVQGGVNKRVASSNVGGGGGTWGSITGTLSAQTDLQAALDANTVVSATTSTAGATITLNMDSKVQKIHVGSASFSNPKTLAMSNTTNALDFIFIFEITDLAAVLTFPADWISDDFNFDGTAWTPGEIGKYKMGGPFDGTNWHVSIVGPNA